MSEDASVQLSDAANRASADALDAARYRWLRDEAVWRGEPDGSGDMVWCVYGHNAYNLTPLDGKDLDEMIDKRMCQGDPGECAFNGACMYRCGLPVPLTSDSGPLASTGSTDSTLETS